MSYVIKEIHHTIQGEGANAGRPCLLVRFAGCNLWSGREADRASAICRFCDTDFRGGRRFRLSELVAEILGASEETESERWPFVVLTGGEPLLQVDEPLIEALHAEGCEVAVETNGTLAAPAILDWVCVSPKAGAPLVQTTGDELKLIYPQPGLEPEALETLGFRHFFIQPMDGPDLARNTALAWRYCLLNPRWRLSLQLHKIIGLP
jgi:7-carboxy-7-deazaguanine synthase (Cx14CxxC type)